MKNKDISIAVIGLGYVGLPLANELSKNFNTTGFDINVKKIKELQYSNSDCKEFDVWKYKFKYIKSSM